MSFGFATQNTGLFGAVTSTAIPAFGATSTAPAFGGFGNAATQTAGFGAGGVLSSANHNPMKNIEVVSPPDDSISSLSFSPQALQQTFLIAGSWDCKVSCWEVQSINAAGQQNWRTVAKAQQSCGGPVLDVAWSDDATRVFTASCDKTVKVWDLASNQMVQIGQHDGPVKTCHWIKGNNYSCLMTGSWDKTLKFWDPRQQTAIHQIQLPDKIYCADVMYPMAVVGLAGRGIIVYNLDPHPSEFKKVESPLKYQFRCVSIFTDKKPINPQPCGFALGSVEGRVAIQYISPQNPRDNFTFKCHRSNETTNGTQEIFAVNDIAFHPHHGTLATVGSDGRFSFWDKDARTKLKGSEQMQQAITRCGFSANGQLFAYSVSYDWSKGHEYYNPQAKNYIFLHPCYADLQPRTTKK